MMVIKLLKFNIFLAFIILNYPILDTYANENSDINPSLEYYNEKGNENYILGPGDVLKISPSSFLPELERVQTIDAEGYINLPKINRIYVSGLSIEELRNLLKIKFLPFIYEPNISIEIIKYKKLEVFISGEINNPGYYSFSMDFNNSFKEIKLFDIIEKSGGITPYSDLENIKVVRKNSISNGSGKIYAEVNFLDFLLKGDELQNLPLRHGDFIKIKKSENLITSALANALKFNLNPEKISVFVNGRVGSPGLKTLPRMTTLNQAILNAGEAKILKGKISFVRTNPDGSLDKRVIKYSKKHKRGSYSNPFLRSGDLILINDGFIYGSVNTLSEITDPFTRIITQYIFFNGIFD